MSTNELRRPMSDEPTERDVHTVAMLMGNVPVGRSTDHDIARAILRSDWYAERIAEARREGAAEVAVRVMEVLQPGCFGGFSPDVDPYDIHAALFRDTP